MRRWRLLSLLAMGAMLLTSPAVGQEAVRRVGVLTGNDLVSDSKKLLLEGFRERGWVVGRNLHVEYRSSEGRAEQIPALAGELVALRPEVIVTVSTGAALAVKAAAPTFPLVFVNVPDPVALGLVNSLASPGGNVTGVTNLVPEGFVGKWFQLLKELKPQASRIAVLQNPTNPVHQRLPAEFPEIERLLGVTLLIVEASRPDQLASAFEAASKQSAEAIAVPGDPMTSVHSAEIVALAAQHRLPAIYLYRQFAIDGGLLSFGPETTGFFRIAGGYAGRILHGERPADLPVQQPTKYYLTVNLKTAATLGITLPSSILARTDEVIE
jgi:putative tryptophan/tyrosine transport system substrate-binding protein